MRDPKMESAEHIYGLTRAGDRPDLEVPLDMASVLAQWCRSHSMTEASSRVYSNIRYLASEAQRRPRSTLIRQVLLETTAVWVGMMLAEASTIVAYQSTVEFPEHGVVAEYPMNQLNVFTVAFLAQCGYDAFQAFRVDECRVVTEKLAAHLGSKVRPIMSS